MKTDKTTEICNRLRQQMMSGIFPPESRLPSQTALIKEFSASNITIQNVMKILGKQGYVDARGPCGTFVAETPPFLKRIALLSPQDEVEERSFFHCFINRGKKIATELGYDLEVFAGYEGWKKFEDYHRLVEQMESGLLAGIIFAANPYLLEKTPLMEYPDIPRVAFMEGRSYSNIDTVWVDYRQLIDKVLDYFCAIGRRRFAMICPQVDPEGYFGISTLERRGIEFSRHLIQGVGLACPSWADNVVRLMMALPEKERPDCLMIADDNLVWHTTSAFKDLEIKIPEDIAVVGHANFPLASDSALPIRRIGFNIDDCLRHCMNTIIARRQGEGVKNRYVLSPLFEDEM